MKENIIYFMEIIATIVLVAIGFIFYEGQHKKGFLKFLSVIMLIFVITIGTTFVFKNQKKNVEEIIIGENSAQEETPIMEIGEIKLFRSRQSSIYSRTSSIDLYRSIQL